MLPCSVPTSGLGSGDFTTFLSSTLGASTDFLATEFSMLNLRDRGGVTSVVYLDLSRLFDDRTFSPSLLASAFLSLSICTCILEY